MFPAICHQDDAHRVFKVLQDGGIAIIPANVGYAIVAITPEALHRIDVVKGRQPHKRHAMLGSYTLHQNIHDLPPREEEMVKLLTVDLDIPLGVVAPYKPDYPIIQNIPPALLAGSSIDGTLSILVNGGLLQEDLSRLAAGHGLAVLGSSANLTGTGAKTCIEDIEPEIIEAADIVIDYGRQKLSYPRASSTMIDFRTLHILRYGACYGVVQDALWRFYRVHLPDDPGHC